jgi:hypothetical protein
MLFTAGSTKNFIYIRNDTSSLILFAFGDQRRLPAARQDRSKCQIINCVPIIFLPPLLTGKVAGNQIFQYAYLQIHQIFTLIDLDSGFSIGSC